MYRSGAWRLSPARAYRALLLRLESALTADTARAREALRQVLGDARLVAEGDAVYAEMETRADRLLLDAMGAGVSNSGCGGAQLLTATLYGQGLTASLTVRLGDHPIRRSRAAS